MIRPADILFYGGGECYQKFGVPFMGMGTRQRVAPTFTRNTAVGRFFDRDGVSRLSSADRLRIEWDATLARPMLLVEPARTNVVLWNRDLTNAAWTKTNVTPAKDQTGIDGITNSASKITASAGNGTCLQAITLASSARFQSAYVKRVTGSGTINMTTDNGATWTAVTVTSSWTRVTIPTQTLADPTVGFRIVTSGDAIAVDFVQNENGVNASSPIATTTASVERAADTGYVPHLHVPMQSSFYAKFVERGGVADTFTPFFIGSDGSSDPRLFIQANGTVYLGVHDPGTGSISSLAAGPTIGQVVELLLTLGSDGTPILYQSINGAAATTGTGQTAQALGTAWSDKRLYFGSEGASNRSVNPIFTLAGARGTRTFDEFRSFMQWSTS